MVIFLLIWTALLTLFTALGFLAVLGKFARVERGFFQNLETLEGVFEVFTKTQGNLETQLQILQKNVEYDNSTLAQSIEQLENRIGLLQETQDRLQERLERGYEERPVTSPELAAIARNKGGRPRKVV